MFYLLIRPTSINPILSKYVHAFLGSDPKWKLSMLAKGASRYSSSFNSQDRSSNSPNRLPNDFHFVGLEIWYWIN